MPTWCPCRFASGLRRLALLVVLAGAAGAQTPVVVAPASPDPACLSLPDLAALPVVVQFPTSTTEAVIKLDDRGQVYVRSEDGAPFALPGTCPPDSYQALVWPARFDAEALTLSVTPPPDTYGSRIENPVQPSPELAAATVQVRAAASLGSGTPGAGVPLGADLDVQVRAQSGPLEARVDLSASAHTLIDPDGGATGRPAVLRARATAAYLSWRRGEQELHLGLVNAGRPLLGWALSQEAAAPEQPVLRLESAGGPYVLRLGRAVLRQGQLEPGTTLIDDLTLPAGEGELILTVDEADGRRVVTLPYHAPGVTPPAGTLTYRIAAGIVPGVRDLSVGGDRVVAPDGDALAAGAMPGAADLRARYQLSPLAALQAHAAIGPDPAAALTLDLETPQGQRGVLSVSARQESRSGVTTLRGAAALSGRAAWGTWNGALGLSRRLDPATGHAETGLDLNLGISTGTLSVQAGLSALAGQPTATLGVGGDFEQGSWKLQGQLSPGRGRLGLGLSLRPDPDGPWVIGAGMQGQPQLSARRPLDTSGWTQARRLPPLQADLSLRALPLPAARLEVSGPLNAGLGLSLGTGLFGSGAFAAFAAGTAAGSEPRISPGLDLALQARVGLAAGRSVLVAQGMSRLLDVRVGVPGVRVSAVGAGAWTGSDGRALLAVPGRELGNSVTVEVDEMTLPISASLTRLSLRVGGAASALAWQADFTPYLERSALRRLTGRTFAPDSVARGGAQTAPVGASGYFVLPAQEGDRIEVHWAGGSCVATYALAEELPCR